MATGCRFCPAAEGEGEGEIGRHDHDTSGHVALSCRTHHRRGRSAGALAGAASPGSVFRIDADVLFTAIGQRGTPDALGGAQIEVRDGRIVVDDQRRTSLKGVWAGGDCVYGGQDLTVSAVEDGKQAARSIAAALGARRT